MCCQFSSYSICASILGNKKLLVLDQWAINTTASLQKEIIDLYENYIFHEIYQKIHNFCVNDMGSFYLDVTKDRQYTTQPSSVARKSAQTSMFYIVNALARWLAPIMPFTSEISKGFETSDNKPVSIYKMIRLMYKLNDKLYNIILDIHNKDESELYHFLAFDPSDSKLKTRLCSRTSSIRSCSSTTTTGR